ncbi:hypothetical protein [Streptomyces melanogenes]|nr:hypothetical protein [Streptomyces melanogenes]
MLRARAATTVRLATLLPLVLVFVLLVAVVFSLPALATARALLLAVGHG